jgi:hypothetical protein
LNILSTLKLADHVWDFMNEKAVSA